MMGPELGTYFARLMTLYIVAAAFAGFCVAFLLAWFILG